MTASAAALSQQPAYFPDKKRLATYFEPVFKKVQLNLRVPRDVKEGIEGLVRIWRHIAKLKGQDPDEIDITFVAIHLLKIGLNGAYADIGGRPTTKEEWDAVLAKISKGITAENK